MDARSVCDSILDTIGETPLVRIRRMNPEPGVEILAKPVVMRSRPWVF